MSSLDFNIFQELEHIKYNDLSKTGKNLKNIFSNLSIESFLHKRKINLNKNFNLKKKDKIDESSTTSIFYENIKKENEENVRKKSIENIKNWNLRYKLRPNLLSYLHKENNKIPPCAYYNPNYNSIIKHIPSIKLKPLTTKRLLKNPNKLTNELNLKKKSKMNIIENEKIIEKEQDNSSISNLNESKNSSKSSNNINNKETRKKTSENKKKKSMINLHKNIHALSFEKYSNRRNYFPKIINDVSTYKPQSIVKKISVPNFKKMLSREKKTITPKQIDAYIDYHPNYNAIFCDGNRSVKNKESKEIIRKKLLLRKIWRSFQTSIKYIVVPEMNKK